MDQAGWTLNGDEQWVVAFKRVGDKIHVLRKNVRYKGNSAPLARALETTYTDSVLMALPIKSVHPIRQSVLVDLNQVFFTNFADLPFGFLDRDRTAWNKVKAFPKNVELQVAAVFGHRPAGEHGHRPVRPRRTAGPRLPAAAGRRPDRVLRHRRQGLRK
jgi:hypothetical protein